MLDILSEPEAKAVLGIAGVLIFVAIAFYIVKAVRGEAIQGIREQTDYLSGFREMYEQGALDEGEFQRVKAELTQSVREQIEREQPVQDDRIDCAKPMTLAEAAAAATGGASAGDMPDSAKDPNAPNTLDPDERDETE